MRDIKPGSFGLSVISGKTGKWVNLGQRIVDGRKEKFTHAFFVLDNDQVIEAEPGGAEIVSIEKYTSRPADQVLFSDKPVQDALRLNAPLMIHAAGGAEGFEQRLRYALVSFARTLEHTPYNYLDYLAIGLEHFHIDLPFVRNRVRREDRMICSQLVDYIYSRNHIQLFDDRRLTQNVTPGDLETYANA